MDDGRNIKKNMVFLYAWYLKTRNNVNENSNYYTSVPLKSGRVIN